MNESQKIKLSVIGIVLLLILATVYVFWVPADDRGTVPEVTVHQSETGRNIRDAERRAESVRENIDRATTGIDSVSERVERSEERTDQIKESNERVRGLVEESRRLSKESRAILEGLPKVDDK